MGSALWSVVIPAICGLLAGVIGSLVAPWVNWSIEKRRQKLKYRQDFIQRCREKIESPGFSKHAFRSTQEYLSLEPFLAKSVITSMERTNNFLVGALDEDGWNPYRRELMRAVEQLEKKWNLI